MPTYTRDDGYLPEDLLQSALHHFDAASELLKKHPAHFDSGGYLLHLAIELYFKAWLLQINNEFDSTHYLSTLRCRVIESGIKLNLSKDENKVLEHLDKLFELRYPNRKTPTEIRTEELELANRILKKLWELVPDDLIKAFEKLPTGSKNGRVLMMKPESLTVDEKFLIE